ncbi:MAG: hypothetical protein Kow00127_17880 [Bacteroidales bacterium]
MRPKRVKTALLIFKAPVLFATLLLSSPEAFPINLQDAQQGLEEVLDEYQNQGWPTSSNSFFIYNGTTYEYNGAVGDKNGGFQPVLVGATLEGQNLPPANEEYVIFPYDTAAFATIDELKQQIKDDFGQYFMLVETPEFNYGTFDLIMRVYPNPSNGNFRVALRNTSGIKDFNLEIYDLTGRMLNRKKYPFNREYPASVTIEQSGLYLIRVWSENKAWTGKVRVVK